MRVRVRVFAKCSSLSGLLPFATAGSVFALFACFGSLFLLVRRAWGEGGRGTGRFGLFAWCAFESEGGSKGKRKRRRRRKRKRGGW